MPLSDSQQPQITQLLKTAKRRHPFEENIEKINRNSDIVSNKESCPQPAYKKYAHLLAGGKLIQGKLKKLPESCEQLFVKFEAIETVLSFLKSRSGNREIFTFDLLKKRVENLTRKTFSETDWRQILTVSSSTFLSEPQENQFSSNYGYLLSVNDRKEIRIDANMSSENQPLLLVEGSSRVCMKKLAERKRNFKTSLSNYCKEDGQVDIPLFDLKKHPSLQQNESNDQAKSITQLLTSSTTSNMSSSAKSALQKITQRNEQLLLKNNSQVHKIDPKPSPAKVGIPLQLLQRIQEREKSNRQRELSCPINELKSIQQKDNLFDISQKLISILTVLKKSSISLQDCVSRIQRGTQFRPIEIEKQLLELSKAVPEWLQIVIVNKNTYLKTEKTFDIRQLSSQLSKYMEMYVENILNSENGGPESTKETPSAKDESSSDQSQISEEPQHKEAETSNRPKEEPPEISQPASCTNQEIQV